MKDKPGKNRRGKASVLSAHAEEQMEAHARTFLANLEHYGIQGVLYLKFPEAEDQFITKSLVGIEEACPICGGDDDLENCVAVRNGQCSHSFHRNCIQRWFSHCGRIICPICKQESLKN